MYHSKFTLTLEMFLLFVIQCNLFYPNTLSKTFSEKSLAKFCESFPIFRLTLLIIKQT